MDNHCDSVSAIQRRPRGLRAGGRLRQRFDPGGRGCDDGNTTNGDGCSASCAIENGFPCNQTPRATSTTRAVRAASATPAAASRACRAGADLRQQRPRGARSATTATSPTATGARALQAVTRRAVYVGSAVPVRECDETGSMTCEPAVGCATARSRPARAATTVTMSPATLQRDVRHREHVPVQRNPAGDIGNPSCESTICDQSGSAQAPANRRARVATTSSKPARLRRRRHGRGRRLQRACKIEDGDPCNADTRARPRRLVCLRQLRRVRRRAGCVRRLGYRRDGVFDFDDIDDDNDGLLDSEEGFGARDTTRCRDGLGRSRQRQRRHPDATEARHRFPDRNGDYLADCPGSVGQRSVRCPRDHTRLGNVVVADALRPTPTTLDQRLPRPRQRQRWVVGSGRGSPAGHRCADANKNGVCDGPDADGDGIATSIDMKPAAFGTMNAGLAVDDDGDQLEDYRDLDSDNDGLLDIIESKNKALDANLDGRIDATGDKDSDGIRDDADDSDLDGTPIARPGSSLVRWTPRRRDRHRQRPGP